MKQQTQTFSTTVYTNCLAYAEAEGLDVEAILELQDIKSWDDEITGDDRDFDEICDGHIDYIELCCKKGGLVWTVFLKI